MVWVNAPAAPRRSQWESSSGTFEYSQRANCGPSCQACKVGYYYDSTPGIERIRTQAGVPRGVPTTYQQQADMATAAGVPSVLVDCVSLDHLERLVMGGRRPITLAVDMSRVPLAYRGYLFQGMHSIELLRRAVKKGVRGWKLNDPNFVDKRKCRRFWPDWLMQSAFLESTQSWAIVPHQPKKLRVEFRSGVRGVNLYDEPGSRKVYADVKAHGIYRHSDGKRLAAHGHNFEFVRYSPTKEYMVLRSFGHTLYAKSKNLHFVKVAQ